MAAVLALPAPGARASTFEVSPVVLELPPGRAAAVVKITNRDVHEINLQIRTFIWSQDEGKDNLTPTEDLAASPPLFKLDPGQSQVIRVLLRTPAGNKEVPYRLLIDELPTAETASAVKFAFRISMPVFAQPAAASKPEMVWKLQCAAGGCAVLARNNGSRRIKFIKMELTLADGAKVTPTAAENPYVLPGAWRKYPLPEGTVVKPGEHGHLSALSDNAPVDLDLAAEPVAP